MSNKAETMFSEKEREVTLTQLNNFHLNPHAIWGMVESYIEHVGPAPVTWVFENFRKDEIMDDRAPTVGLVEIHISTAGYLSNMRGNPMKLDQTYCRLAASSYYNYMRPLPVSFQMGDAIEVHFRTPGVSDFEKKNPLREISLLKQIEREKKKS